MCFQFTDHPNVKWLVVPKSHLLTVLTKPVRCTYLFGWRCSVWMFHFNTCVNRHLRFPCLGLRHIWKSSKMQLKLASSYPLKSTRTKNNTPRRQLKNKVVDILKSKVKLKVKQSKTLFLITLWYSSLALLSSSRMSIGFVSVIPLVLAASVLSGVFLWAWSASCFTILKETQL